MSDVLTAVLLKNYVLWDVTSCQIIMAIGFSNDPNDFYVKGQAGHYSYEFCCTS